MGSVSLKKPYFSSKREGAPVFISNCSSYCQDHISAETQANFNLAHLFFVLTKCYFEKYQPSSDQYVINPNKEFPCESKSVSFCFRKPKIESSVNIAKKDNRHPLSVLSKADKLPILFFICFLKVANFTKLYLPK